MPGLTGRSSHACSPALFNPSAASTNTKHAAPTRAWSSRGGGLDFSDVALGDSIAVNGVCLTAVALTPDSFSGRRVGRNPALHRRFRTGRRSQSGKGAAAGRPARRPSGKRACRRRRHGAALRAGGRIAPAGNRCAGRTRTLHHPQGLDHGERRVADGECGRRRVFRAQPDSAYAGNDDAQASAGRQPRQPGSRHDRALRRAHVAIYAIQRTKTDEPRLHPGNRRRTQGRPHGRAGRRGRPRKRRRPGHGCRIRHARTRSTSWPNTAAA